MLTTNSVVVRWRTDELATNYVRYGESPDQLNKLAWSAGMLTEHIVQVGGLKPDTKYYYSVCTTNRTLAGGTADYWFITAPPIGVRRPTRIWVLGDSGTANTNAAAVRDAYLSFTGKRRTDLWLMLGDNAYMHGTDLQYQGAVFEMYPAMLRNSPLWPSMGNHDNRSSSATTQSGIYYDIFTLPTQGQAGGLMSGTEAYYSFDYANVHFVCLDSEESDRAPNGMMATWLKNDLKANKRDWTIAYFHHPPYTKGSHDSDAHDKDESGGRLREVRENILPILERGGVDLVLAGHSHSYERSFLMNGHFGKSPTLAKKHIKNGDDGREDGDGAYRKRTFGRPAANQGTVYVVAGSSGKVSGGTLNHPMMFTSTNSLGSLVLDFDGNRMDATFINQNAEKLDHFTIIKGRAPRRIAQNNSVPCRNCFRD